MARYPVRCCCDGTKLYGFLEMPRDGYKSGERTMVQTKPAEKIEGFSPSYYPPSRTSKTETIEFRLFIDLDHDLREISVYSDDRPIEFWRTLRGFTELKPVMQFTTRTLARDLRAESEALGRRVDFHRNRGPMSMADAAALSRSAHQSTTRMAEADVVAISNQIRYVCHPSAMPVLIVVARDLLLALSGNRGAYPSLIEDNSAIVPTFMGIEIAEDPSMPSGTYEVFIEPATAYTRLVELKRQSRDYYGPGGQVRTAD